MATGEGLRARKKRERRRRIEDVALEMFERDGFDGTTVEAIAAAAEIAPRTFFHYFPTKEDVVIADYADRLARTVDELAAGPADLAPWAALRRSFLVVAADYEAERDNLLRRFRLMAATPAVMARNLEVQARWEASVAQVLAGRLDAPVDDVTPRLLAATALAVMRASLAHWLQTGGRGSLPDEVAAAFDRLGAGLARAG